MRIARETAEQLSPAVVEDLQRVRRTDAGNEPVGGGLHSYYYFAAEEEKILAALENESEWTPPSSSRTPPWSSSRTSPSSRTPPSEESSTRVKHNISTASETTERTNKNVPGGQEETDEKSVSGSSGHEQSDPPRIKFTPGPFFWPLLSVVRCPFDRLLSIFQYPFPQQEEDRGSYWRPLQQSFADFVLSYEKHFWFSWAGGTAPLKSQAEFLALPGVERRNKVARFNRVLQRELRVLERELAQTANASWRRQHRLVLRLLDDADSSVFGLRAVDGDVAAPEEQIQLLQWTDLMVTDVLKYENLEVEFDGFTKR